MMKCTTSNAVVGWEMGKKQGPGKISWTNGDTFEGNFVNDLREGIVHAT